MLRRARSIPVPDSAARPIPNRTLPTMTPWMPGFLGTLAIAAIIDVRGGEPMLVRTRGAVSARPTCGFLDGPRNRIVRSTEFPRAPWTARGSIPDLAPRIEAAPQPGPAGTTDAVAVEFDTRGLPTPERWSFLETQVPCQPGVTYTFSFSVKGPEGSFLTARGAAGAGFSRIPLNGRWQRVHLTEQATDPMPMVRIGLGAHGSDEPTPSSSVRVLLAAPQMMAGRGVLPYEPSGESMPPDWPLELVPPDAVRRPCTDDECGAGAATNILRWSTRLDQGSWASTGLQPVARARGPSPTGMLDAHGIDELPGPGPHALTQEFTPPVPAPVAASAFVMPQSRTAAMLTVSSNGAVAQARFDLSGAGTVSSSSGGRAGIERVGRGWYRLTLCTEAAVGGRGTFSLALLDRAEGMPEYAGDGTSGLLVWGPQVEVGQAATCHIPTFFTPETRGADEPVTPQAPP